MSDQTDDLGPAPEPQITSPEPDPGGVDAVSNGDGVHTPEDGGEPLPRDLHPDANPATGEVLPEGVTDSDDTSTEASASDTAQTSSEKEDSA